MNENVVSVGVSADMADILAVVTILEIDTSKMVSIKRVARATGWEASRAESVLRVLETYGVLSPIGLGGKAFSVNAEAIKFVKDISSNPKEAVVQTEKVKLRNELPTTSDPLDKLLAKINGLPKLKIMSEEEIEAAKTSCFERLVSKVEKTNMAIVRMSESSELISADTDLVSIKRTENGVYAYFYRYGGKKERELFKYSWPKMLSARWSDSTVADAERHCCWLVNEMMKFISNNS